MDAKPQKMMNLTLEQRNDFLQSLPTTFNVCRFCGDPIERNDYCFAESIDFVKTGKTFIGSKERLVFQQHHLKCGKNQIAPSIW